MRISEPAVQAKSVATPYEAQFEQLGGETTDRTIILSLPECREVATIDRMYTNGERDLAKESATAASMVRACNSHTELVDLLTISMDWHESLVPLVKYDHENAEALAAHMREICAALAKATATE